MARTRTITAVVALASLIALCLWLAPRAAHAPVVVAAAPSNAASPAIDPAEPGWPWPAGSRPYEPTEQDKLDEPYQGFWNEHANQVTKACLPVANRLLKFGEPYVRDVGAGCDAKRYSKDKLVKMCEDILALSDEDAVQRVYEDCDVLPPGAV